MYQFFVYLIKSENRLTILRQKVDNPDYLRLMDNNGGNEHQLQYLCKNFCLGYILGAENGKRPINNLYEFQ
jgi:hypothetical protein